MKSLRFSLLLLTATIAFAGLARAAGDKTTPFEKPASCCKKAADAGGSCAHGCCVAAAKDGKNCEKCGGKNKPESEKTQ